MKFYLELLDIGLTLLGLFGLLAGFYNIVKLIRRGTALVQQWKILALFLAFFILGYLLFLIHAYSTPFSSQALLTGGVFFGGGIFVFLVTSLFCRTIEKIESAQLIELANKELQYSADRDDLTGVFKRRYFENRLKKALNSKKMGSAQRFVLLYVDVNDFKAINDTYGHLIGDALLKKVASALSTGLREKDVVARLGGDEFVVLAELSTNMDLTSFAELFLARLEELTLTYDGKEIHPGLSVGVTTFDAHAQSIEDVIKLADAGCYMAKKKKQVGRSHFAIAL